MTSSQRHVQPLTTTRDAIWTKGFAITFVAHFFFSLGFWAFVHLPGYLKLLGGGEAQIGAIIGSLSISAILIRPWLGTVMDRRGRRPVVLIGAVANVMAVSAYLTASSISPWIYAIRILHGVGQAALFSVMFTIAADLVPVSRRTEGLAIFGVSGLVPLSLGGLLGDWILGHWDYDMLFASAAAIALVALILCLFIEESRPARDSARAPVSLLRVFAQRGLRPLWILTLGFTFSLASYFTFIKTYIATIEVGSVGLFFLAYSVASVLLRLFFSWLPDRLGPKRALIPALLSLALGILILSRADSTLDVLLAGALCGQGHAFVFPIISALVVGRTHPDDRGVAMTLFTSLFDVGALLGAPILGWIIEGSSYTTMFTVAAGTVSTLACLFFFVDRAASAKDEIEAASSGGG